MGRTLIVTRLTQPYLTLCAYRIDEKVSDGGPHKSFSDRHSDILDCLSHSFESRIVVTILHSRGVIKKDLQACRNYRVESPV